MSTPAAGAAKSLISSTARIPHAVSKKYTIQSTGIWERIRRALAVDPNRSNGVPLNPQYRNPPPGVPSSEQYGEYEDPVTVPAGDLAENYYFNRDTRRAYPKTSVITQSRVAGLLAVGSKVAPKQELIGEAGSKQLATVEQEGKEKGVGGFLQTAGEKAVSGVLGEDGGPVWPTGLRKKEYVMDRDRSEGFPEEYPCRTFV